MHIVDGVLSNPVLVSSAGLTLLGVAVGLRKIEGDDIPKVGVFSATFFIASLVHIPVGPSSVHLILNGLIGITLGWAAFPALLIALLLQAIFFGFGGLVVLGANTLNIALPAVLVYYLYAPLLRRSTTKLAAIWGFAAGSSAIALTTVFVGFSLALSGEEFLIAAKLAFVTHIPVMLVEGLFTAAAVFLLCKVKPEILMGEPHLSAPPSAPKTHP